MTVRAAQPDDRERLAAMIDAAFAHNGFRCRERLPHLFSDQRPPALEVAALGDLGGAIGAAMLVRPDADPA